MNRYVIVSGSPASGKSTLARLLAKELALSVLDKDDFLEARFEGSTVGDPDTRRKLSRAADQELRRRAERSNGAIMTSWWKHPNSPGDSGTPTEWLASLPGVIVEVHCRCDPVIAARRFVDRRRHPGHLDNRWSYPELLVDFVRHASQGPLGVGSLVVIQTDGEIELGALTRTIAQAWEIKKKPPEQTPPSGAGQLCRYLDIFDAVADRVSSSLQKHQLEVIVGTWLNSSVLKVRKRRWTDEPAGPDSAEAGIFFSVWVEEKGAKKNRAFYNIHALRIRNLRAYSLQSREFAAAFRERFARQKRVWPEVSVNYGPQTLMQGWIALDEDRLEEEVVRLVHLFIPLSDTIDELLDQRKG